MGADWDSLLNKFEDQLSLWKTRQLSLRGRAMIANMLGLSLFWYQATIFDFPKTVIFRVNKLLFPFVWNKKREWMARTSVTQPLAVGGLGVVDITRKVSSLRVVWLHRSISLPGQHPWTCFLDHHVSLVFPHQDAVMLLSRDTIPAYLIKKLPPSYASLVTTWVQLKGKRDAGLWVIPRPSVDPLPIDELTSSRCYSILSQYQHIDHRSLAKFRDWGIPVDWKRVWSTFISGVLFAPFRTLLGCHTMEYFQLPIVSFAST
jgi:hypothetical protein